MQLLAMTGASSLPLLGAGGVAGSGAALATVAAVIGALLLLLFRDPRAARAAARGLKPLSSLPTPPGAYPLLGHAPQLLHQRMHLTLTDWARQLGGVYRLRLADKRVVVVTDPKIALPLLSSGPEALPKAVRLRRG
eukprot:361816-Chlamydomonas_euryale.AAC.3